MNNKLYSELYVFGLGRSGTSAIINWLKGEYTKKTKNIFVSQKKGLDIFFNHKECRSNYHIYKEGYYGLNAFYRKIIKNKSFIDIAGRKIILVLRDPYNFFASCLHQKKVNDNNKSEIMIRAKEAWKTYAEQIVGHCNYLLMDYIFINYNKWSKNILYRRKIVKKLFINPLSDKNFTKVPHNGGGSSFDFMKYKNCATKMDINNRWRVFAKDDFYLSLLDKEVINYSNKIFYFNPLNL